MVKYDGVDLPEGQRMKSVEEDGSTVRQFIHKKNVAASRLNCVIIYQA